MSTIDDPARPDGEHPNGWWQASDGQWYPPQAEPEPEPEPEPGKRSWWLWSLALVLTAVLGATAGFAASALHPGPRGHQGAVGATGAPGPAGPAGPAGPSGSDAQVTDLGVCVNTVYGTVYGVSVATAVTVEPPSKHPDGTTYCPFGSYVPVKPQFSTN